MAKRFLDELRWHPKKSLNGVEIVYLHRGAPNDRITILAEDVIKFESSFFVVERNNMETRIPYHRIREIRRGSEVLWHRN